MRRKDREIKDINEIISMLNSFEVCNIALYDGEYPYVIPLNFGYSAENGKVKLYFHGALEGKKIGLIKNNNSAGFSMYKVNEFVINNTDGANSTCMYESVCGQGKINFIEDLNEKVAALNKIMLKYSGRDNFEFNENMIKRTCVYELIVESISGKKH